MDRKYIYAVIRDGCGYEGEYENCASVTLHATEEDAQRYVEDAMRTCAEDDLVADGVDDPSEEDIRKRMSEVCMWYDDEHTSARYGTSESVADWNITRLPLPAGV